jgi:hypothetical protein
VRLFCFCSASTDNNEPIHQASIKDDKDSKAPITGPRIYDNDERPRRKYDFNNNHGTHHVIVKSYNNQMFHSRHHQQDSTAEEEPEWFSEGPTSRLDTIELKGFDDDVADEGEKTEQKNTSTGKRISFFDELSHYGPQRPIRKHQAGKHAGGQHHENDVESVGASPPARSTPTKGMAELSLNDKEGNVNVSNFEDFMKFDSMLNVSRNSEIVFVSPVLCFSFQKL